MGLIEDYYSLPFSDALASIRYIRMISCIIGAMMLLSIWYDTQAISTAEKSDLGYLFTFAALLVWIVIDIDYLVKGDFITNGIKKAFSTANNFLFLASITYYTHGFPWLKKRVKPKHVTFTLGIIGLIIALGMYYLWEVEAYRSSIIVLDRLITLLTVILLLFVISKSFLNRKYGYGIVLISIVTFIIMVDTQTTFERGSNLAFKHVFFLCSQIGFIIILVLHAGSWHEEVRLSEVLNDSQKDKIIQLKEKIRKLELEVATTLSQRLESITPAERKVLNNIALTESEIADTIGVSVGNVKDKIKFIKLKLDIHTKRELEELVENQQINNAPPPSSPT